MLVRKGPKGDPPEPPVVLELDSLDSTVPTHQWDPASQESARSIPPGTRDRSRALREPNNDKLWSYRIYNSVPPLFPFLCSAQRKKHPSKCPFCCLDRNCNCSPTRQWTTHAPHRSCCTSLPAQAAASACRQIQKEQGAVNSGTRTVPGEFLETAGRRAFRSDEKPTTQQPAHRADLHQHSHPSQRGTRD